MWKPWRFNLHGASHESHRRSELPALCHFNACLIRKTRTIWCSEMSSEASTAKALFAWANEQQTLWKHREPEDSQGRGRSSSPCRSDSPCRWRTRCYCLGCWCSPRTSGYQKSWRRAWEKTHLGTRLHRVGKFRASQTWWNSVLQCVDVTRTSYGYEEQGGAHPRWTTVESLLPVLNAPDYHTDTLGSSHSQ